MSQKSVTTVSAVAESGVRGAFKLHETFCCTK